MYHCSFRYYLNLALFTLFIVICSCNPQIEETDDNEVVLAEVYDHRLTYSDIAELIPHPTTQEDSLMRLRAIVENWVREALVLHKAEMAISPDIDIEKLIEDYRSSLLIHNYELDLIESQMDTTVTPEELQRYYEANMDQYQLESTIVRCHFIKLPRPIDNRDSLRVWWESESPADFRKLIRYCNEQQVEIFMLTDSTWYKVDEITQLLPPGTLSQQSMKAGRTFQFSDETSEYYIRILEKVKNQEIAPLSYIQSQAKRYIMHQRKLTLMEKIKSDLYKEEIQGNEVKIYVE